MTAANVTLGAEGEPRRRRTRAENRDYRRESLIEAATRIIAMHDLSGATVERICEEAGVSHGLLGHYFDSKEQLLGLVCEAAWERDLTLKRAIKEDGTLGGLEKLDAMVESTFQGPFYTADEVAVWRAFLHAEGTPDLFREPIRAGAEAYRAIFAAVFTQAAGERGCMLDADRAAMGLTILIDGFWISLSTGKDEAAPEDAISLCKDYLRLQLDAAHRSSRS